MVEPRQGQRPTGRTTVRVLAGPRALVFGVRCDDPDAAHIVSFTKERDGDFATEDHILIVLDPFQDGRSGYVFAVNPGGASTRTGTASGKPPFIVTPRDGRPRSGSRSRRSISGMA